MDRQIKVLVVDDSRLIRKILSDLLKDNFDVVFAVDGKDGIDKFQAVSPQIILLDLEMPRMNGLEVIDYVRNKANDSDVFILVLTGKENPEIKVQALNLGANDFLIKPFPREELIARMNVASRQVNLLSKLHKAYDQIAREINMVAELQKKLLPRSQFVFPGVDLQYLYIPSGMASGDYFDYFVVRDDVLRFVVADVSGHGARAAFIMAMVRTLFAIGKEESISLKKSIQLINDHLCHVVGDDTDFVTLFACDLNLKEKTLKYVNAGHCPALIKLDRSRVERLDSYLPALGFFPLEIEQKTISFSHKVGVFLFTDGFYEWEVEPKKILGLDNFLRMAQSLIIKDAFNLQLLKRRLDFMSGLQNTYRDDLTALWVEAR